MNILEKPLKLLAKLQNKAGAVILAFFFIFTIFMGYQALGIELESDFNELMPQHLPIFQLNDKITDELGGQDTIFILLMLDGTRNTPVDIRHPDIMRYVVDLDKELSKESAVDSVSSVATVLGRYPALSEAVIGDAMDQYPQAASFISEDKQKTFLLVQAEVGGAEENVQRITNMIQEKLDTFSKPAGTKVMITGTPPIRTAITDLLKSDAIYTLALASVIILVLLFILQRSFKHGIIIFTPIFLSILWTMGTMSYLGLKLSIVTAGLGAMILGLGVEYGVFMLTRYREEKYRKKEDSQVLEDTVKGVGSAIVGSGTTTIVGFMALTFSIMPMLQQLGQSLALGIFYSIIAAVVVEPIIIKYLENEKTD